MSRLYKKVRLSGDDAKDAMLGQEKNRRKKETVIDRIQLLGQNLKQLNPAEALSLSIEYYRFMALKVESDIDDKPSKLAPSALIDDMWHTHLLDTRSYMMLESLLLPGGGKIHHNPLKNEQADYEGRLAHTKNLYYDFYHSVPPHEIWGNETHLGNAADAEVDHGKVISDPEEVDDRVITSEAEEIEHEKAVIIELLHPNGKRQPVRILKKSLGRILFGACTQILKLEPNTFKLIFHDRPISAACQCFLDAEDGDVVTIRLEMRGC